MSKLSRYCEAWIEAGWLAALVLIPLFFNVYSSRVFEPDKITLLRSIALTLIAAWVILQVERRRGTACCAPSDKHESWGDSVRAWLRTPLVLPALALVAVYLIATIFSVTPRVSLLGSYQRLQGTYTLLSYVTVFAMLLSAVRRQEQIDRLITVVVLTSLPISLYGLLQKLGIDPLPWGGDVVTRIAANMGNAIFIAAYLIMVFPLTVARIIEAFADILRREKLSTHDIIRGAGYTLIAVLQVLAIYFSGSRGPWLGWLAGLFFLGYLAVGVLAAMLFRRARGLRGLALGLVTGWATAIVLFLVVLNLPNSPLAHLRDTPYLGRLGTVFETESGTGRVRVLIWEGAVDLISPHDPLVFPDGRRDPYNALRPLIGYGPESMYVAYNRFYPPELAHLESRNASPDRAHNETLDALVITGGLGLVVQLFLFGAVFYYGLKWLGLIQTTFQRWLFIALYIGAGLIGAAIAWASRGEAWIGVGLPTGIGFGVGIYGAISVLFLRTQGSRLPFKHQLLIIVLLSAIIAHFVEIHFGIAIAATRLYFWAFSALIVVTGHLMPMADEGGQRTEDQARSQSPSSAVRHPSSGKRRRQSPAASRPQAPDGLGPTLVLGGFVALILMVVGFEFITNPPRGSSTLQVLWGSLTTLQRQEGATSYGALLLILITWVLCSLLAAAELGRQGVFERAGVTWWTGFSAILALSGAAALLCYLAVAGALASIVGERPAGGVGIELVVAIAGRVAGMLKLFYIFTFALIALLAAALIYKQRLPPLTTTTWGGATGLAALILVPLLIVNSNLNIILADIIYKQAEPYEKQGMSLRTATDPQQRQLLAASWQAAVTLHEQALSLAPNEDYYYLFLGRAYLELATALDDPAAQDRLLETARDKLLLAQRINPLNTDHAANLGRLHRRWADLLSLRAGQYEQQARQAEAADARRRASEKAEEADSHYTMATTLSPHNALLWNEWASLRWDNFRDFEGALARYQRSLEIDPEYDQTYLALTSLYYERAQATTNREEKLQYYQQLVPYGEKAVQLNPKLARAWDNLSVAYVELGRCQQGITATQTLLSLISEHEPTIWNAHRNLAISLRDCGRYPEALNEAQKAYDLAPESQRPLLQELINDVRSRMGAASSTQTP